MESSALYTRLLGVVEPWFVSYVVFDEVQECVFVHVDLKPGAGLVCPRCSKGSPGYDHLEERRWRHLDSCGFKTYLVAKVPRVECAEHGVQSVAVPWSKPHSRFTLDFEKFAILLLHSCKSQSRAARLLRLKPGQVHDVMHRAVKRGLARREAVSVPYLSLDEKSFLSHKRFVSVLTDLEGMRVLDICRDRTMDDASALIRSALTQEQLARVKCVTMDMWDGYVAAVRMTIPQADIVFDRFHVSRYLVEAVNQTRIEESKRLVKQGDMSLKGSKFFWSYSAEKVSSKLKAKYGHLLQVNLATAKAWALKETFRSFFAQQGTQEGRQFFLEWRQSVSESGNRFMSKVSKMLERYYHGLENYLIHHKTNSAAEGVNSLIHEIKFAARGFRTFEGFRTAILFFLGGLNLYPQKTS